MRKMNTIENGTDFAACKMGKLDAACVRYGLGRNSIQKMAKEAGATVKVGKCRLFNFTILDAYVDSISGRK